MGITCIPPTKTHRFPTFHLKSRLTRALDEIVKGPNSEAAPLHPQRINRQTTSNVLRPALDSLGGAGGSLSYRNERRARRFCLMRKKRLAPLANIGVINLFSAKPAQMLVLAISQASPRTFFFKALCKASSCSAIIGFL